MSCIECVCGAKYDRIASHKKRVLGFQCRNCMRHWRTCRMVDEKGQTEMWFKYYECKCGSNTLNIPSDIPFRVKYCVCPVVDLR